MKSLGIVAAALLASVLWTGTASQAEAQVVYYTARPVAVYPMYRPYYPTPAYSYYGGWYPGSYMNNYGNYGAYHVMTPVWNGGYGYRYRYGW
jgi:hypothetical protein